MTAVAVLLLLSAPHAPSEVEKAMEMLRKAEWFAVGPVGYVGAMSHTERAMRMVMAGHGSTANLVKLTKSTNIATAFYGFVGLRWTDVAAFRDHARTARPKGKVLAFAGCVIREKPASEIWKRIFNGGYDGYKHWRPLQGDIGATGSWDSAIVASSAPFLTRPAEEQATSK